MKNATNEQNYVDQLIYLTNSADRVVRDDAIQKLSSTKANKSSVIKCLENCLGDEWWVARCSAMYSLSEMKAKDLTNAIISRYNSWNFLEKEWVLISLAKMEDPKSIPFLKLTFKRSRKIEYKILSCCALSILGECDFNKMIESVENPNESQALCINTCKEIISESRNEHTNEPCANQRR